MERTAKCVRYEMALGAIKSSGEETKSGGVNRCIWCDKSARICLRGSYNAVQSIFKDLSRRITSDDRCLILMNARAGRE